MSKSCLSLVRGLAVLALACCWNPSLPCHAAETPARPAYTSVLGTWKGESICVGNRRPACKDEVIVYRFEAVPDTPGVVMLLADKIIEGQRLPMGKLEFQYDETKGTLACEFTKGQTHGLWRFQVTENAMEGTLVLLPGREPGRRVKVKRVDPKQVPAAPDRKAYEEE